MSATTNSQRTLTAQSFSAYKQYLVQKLQQQGGFDLFDRKMTHLLIEQAIQKSGVSVNGSLKEQLVQEVFEEVFGLGPVQPFLEDPQVTEIMINGAKRVYVEKKGLIYKTDVSFANDQQVMNLIERVVRPLGRRIDADHPAVDARLPDGSRFNAVIPPVAIDGPSVTIRKFSRERLTVEKLIELGSLTPAVAEFLQACVVARLNIVISGGTGSGKTTLLNILSGYIPERERIVTIEDAAELQLHQEHVVRLETKPPDLEGKGEVRIRDLVRNALRMRPDRIVVGECRGGEALDMLQAMNTGHDGSLTTIHANTPRDALSRLETLALMAGMELPLRIVREQIASAVDLIIQVSRLRDGSRKVTQVTEVVGMEGDTIVLTDIFKFTESGSDKDGKVLGELKPTGMRPLFINRLELAGFKLRPEVFGVNLAEILSSGRRQSGRV
ncbi:MAG: Type II/IV secretion system ATP hydrolase TadA/VirB11/CpaF, TadA subfamily [Anaerolineae bacterium]|jgi:pilus assembly protein CpaF|nr:MAG: Type II/IV secretion system ATP hydrolase TadA/VirB11/CpaF, TadA subfamily [Anaerolineae bacterium]